MAMVNRYETDHDGWHVRHCNAFYGDGGVAPRRIAVCGSGQFKNSKTGQFYMLPTPVQSHTARCRYYGGPA